ncbi:MAG: 30S ribosomal protein S4 [Candidatus Yanofskybacteria bacterium RIFCSPHIGHO2_01_FULL_42_12]|uniref:Small ribosomal subunit protein uS4 n=1 Tax=Candidatus Yanofskybacteria bacterium RIFCSPLOWO2_01_FULL_42_49 TaxID=1802694 RepID=A0A1F8GCK1_9BACT|nr:MAG: 30S ribosomal protein S4 [Candidatus Yanofskybacteria bacterium RIFCSPHIGHO2_01_FULL_42_12]OGN22780.1 MAG: 30S ribosomal protein S4 [Candidatus Yanofskybacteria bacterium RIFCSPLOWO2_01_FULL_42_49]
MARYTGPKEKIERRLGERLLLKGERSLSPKSAIVKKPYPPGIHGNKRRSPRKMSEYGQQLHSKQKIRNTYRLMERQFKNYVKSALASKKDLSEAVMNKLEYRLDNVVYRLGIAQSRDQARQIVNHGHILVNDRKVSIPSYEVKMGDTIKIREGSKKSPFFAILSPQWIAKHEAPPWLELDKNQMTGRIKGRVSMDESGINPNDLQAIIEFYSR